MRVDQAGYNLTWRAVVPLAREDRPAGARPHLDGTPGRPVVRVLHGAGVVGGATVGEGEQALVSSDGLTLTCSPGSEGGRR